MHLQHMELSASERSEVMAALSVMVEASETMGSNVLQINVPDDDGEIIVAAVVAVGHKASANLLSQLNLNTGGRAILHPMSRN